MLEIWSILITNLAYINYLCKKIRLQEYHIYLSPVNTSQLQFAGTRKVYGIRYYSIIMLLVITGK